MSADDHDDVIPAHLRPLFKGKLTERARKSLKGVLNKEVDKLSTGRFGRAFKLSKFTVKGGSRALLGAASDLMAGEGKDHAAGLALAEEMVKTFSNMRGLTMKAGQMLSYLDDTLPPEAQRILAILQRDVSPMSWSVASQQLEKAFQRPLNEVYASIEEQPIAAASIGQVHRAVLANGTKVAVKVQYPGIEDAMKSDLRNADMMSAMKRMMFPNANIREVMAELEQRFLDECDYLKEAEYQQDYREIFAGHPYIVVPEVHHDHCRQRVLTTTFHEGRGFYEWLADDPSLEARNTATRAFYRFYIGALYLDGLFNCDPHPGNYLFADDGKIVFLDYGCARRFSEERVQAWINMNLAVESDDFEIMEPIAREIGFIKEGVDYDRDGFRELIRYIYYPYLLEEPLDFATYRPQETFQRMFLENRNLFKLSMPADAVFLNRISFGLTSLIGEMGTKLFVKPHANAYFSGVDPDRPDDPRTEDRKAIASARPSLQAYAQQVGIKDG